MRGNPVKFVDPTGEIIPVLVAAAAAAVVLLMPDNAHAPEIDHSEGYRAALDARQQQENFATGAAIATAPIGVGAYNATTKILAGLGERTAGQVIGGAIAAGGTHQLAVDVLTGQISEDPTGFVNRWAINSVFWAAAGILSPTNRVSVRDGCVGSTNSTATKSFIGDVPAKITITNGVADVRIGYVVQMNEAEILAMRHWAAQNGARSAVIRTGEMVNTDWAIDLGRRAQGGRTFLGGTVKDVSKNGIPQFEIHFEKIE